MSEPTQCSDCGAEIPPGQPKGLCPRCALKGALELADDDSESTAAMRVVPQTGERIGRYKLLEKIGEGGCGVVYMAEQEEPVRRRVALKVIKPGMDSREVIARFEAERQALALMEHPCIAKVFDGGATETGRPYFVMELVRGLRITEYCDQKNLSTRQRLDLFMRVCQAVQHAHQKGIIHRDLKPSNILVTVNDGVPVPKVIDFGIAKATGQALTDKTLFTRFHQFLGTPAYISPEQAEMTSVDIDTRSDIYSLGVLLYELLTGRTPFDIKELLRSGMEEMLRTIREHEPVRPSVRLNTLTAIERTTVAQKRQTDAPKLINSLRGDLDWIVMKCLEKDRQRRYETANGLAADVHRHLTNEPVLAGPPTARYRLKKFVRKHRAAVAVAAGFVLLLTVATSVSTRMAIWANRERESARHAETTAEKARERAEENAEAETRARAEAQMHRIRAEEDFSNMQIQRSEDFFDAGDAPRALAYLARVLLTSSSNRVAAERLMSALALRTFTLPLTQPIRHDGSVDSAEFSGDGLRVVMVSGNTARVWDVESGKPITTPLLHQDRVWSAQFSPDGRKVVTVAGRSARVWDVQTGEEHSKPLGHDAEVAFAQFSPDGLRVLTVSRDRETREDDFPITHLGAAWVWEVQTGTLLTGPLHGKGRVDSAQFSADGKWVLTASSDRMLQVWESQSGNLVKKLNGHNDDVSSAQFSRDGLRVVTVAGNNARVWDADTGEELTKPLQHETSVTSAQFSPNGLRVVTASSDKTVQVWDVRSAKPLTKLAGHDDEVSSVQFSPDGLRVVTASQDKTAMVWDAATGKLLNEPIRKNARVLSAQFSADGTYLVMALEDGTAQAWDARPGSGLSEPLRHTASVRFAEFSPDGLQVITASKDKTACVWDAKTGKAVTKSLYHNAEVSSARFSPNGQQIVTASSDGIARLWDARTGELLNKLLGHEGGIFHAEFSPNGQQIVTASSDGSARVWDARTGGLFAKLIGHRSGVFSAHFSVDGLRVVTASSDKTARIWDAISGSLLTEPLPHKEDVISAQFSRDGLRVVTASRDKTAMVWDAKSGKPLTEPLRHEDVVWSAEFSPDGLWVVTASWDRTARVWNTKTGKSLTEPLRHMNQLHSARFSPDGLRVVTASSDHTARVWDAQTGKPLTEPLRHESRVLSAQFSPDGLQVVTASEDKTARVWEMSFGSVPAPPWLAQLAEAVAGKRLTGAGVLEPVGVGEFLKLKEQLSMAPATNFYTLWAKWFFADRATRTISPLSSTTVPEYVRRRIEENREECLSEALLLSPTNALAWARLGIAVLRRDGTNDLSRNAEAEWCAERASSLSPRDAEVVKAVAEIRRKQGLP